MRKAVSEGCARTEGLQVRTHTLQNARPSSLGIPLASPSHFLYSPPSLSLDTLPPTGVGASVPAALGTLWGCGHVRSHVKWQKHVDNHSARGGLTRGTPPRLPASPCVYEALGTARDRTH